MSFPRSPATNCTLALQKCTDPAKEQGKVDLLLKTVVETAVRPIRRTEAGSIRGGLESQGQMISTSGPHEQSGRTCAAPVGGAAKINLWQSQPGWRALGRESADGDRNCQASWAHVAGFSLQPADTIPGPNPAISLRHVVMTKCQCASIC